MRVQVQWRPYTKAQADPGRPKRRRRTDSPRAAPGLHSYLLVGNAGRPGLFQGQVLETLCPPRISPRTARGGRRRLDGAAPPDRRSGAPASRHLQTPTVQEVAGPGMRCGLQFASHATRAALHRLLPSFLLTAWKPPRRPLSHRLGVGEGRAACLEGGKAVDRHRDLIRACLFPGAKDCTLSTPSPAYRKSQTTSPKIA